MPILFDPLTGEMLNLPLASSTQNGLLSSTGAAKLESVVIGYVGYYATPTALTTAHPTGEDGQFASIGTTDTFWIWDSDTNAWKDSGTASVVTWSTLTGKPTTIVLMKSGTVDDAGVITLSDETEVADLPIAGFVQFTAANTAQGVAIGDIYQKKLQDIVISETTVTNNIAQFIAIGKEATATKAGLLSAAGFTKLGSLSAFEPSSEFWVDSNFAGEVSDGTINKPFKTFSAAVAAITSDCAIHLAPGAYTEASSVAMPAYACSIYGNRASLAITGNFTVYIGSEIRGLSLNVTGVFSSARCYYENCDITAGSIVSLGQMRINFCQVIGDITVNATKGFDANLSEITGRIIANGDSCRIVDCVIQCNSASPAIYSTAGYLIVMGAVIYNTGGGGDISCDNGASTLPNIITNVYCYTGGVACGDAVTVTNGSVTVLTTFTGTAIRSGKTLMALGSDTTGDIYCRGSNGFLTRIASPEAGKFLGGNGVGSAPSFSSVPWGSVSDKVLATSEVDGLLSAAGYAKLSNITAGYLGYYATEAALIAAHPTGTDGDFASIGATDTLWAWDSDTSAWKNTNNNTINPTWDSITGKPDLASSGANSDITSLTGLTTALSVSQGGTGLSSLGTAGQVLRVNSGATALEFATPSGGMSNPMTTAGDIIIGETSGVPARLAAGTDGYVFTAQGAETAPAWAALPTVSAGTSVTSGGLAKWSLNNVLTNPWGVSLTNNGVTFSVDAGRDGDYVGIFNGSAYCTFDSSSFPTGASPWSVCAWIKTTSASEKFILTWGADGSGTIVGPKVDSGVFKLERASGAISSGILVNDGSWHHVVATYDGTTIRTYVDTVAGGASAFTMSVSSSSTGHLGCWPALSGFFSGSISDVRVYNRAISTDEIAIIYEGEIAARAGIMSSSDKVKLDGLPSSAIAAPSSPAQGDILYYNGSAWAKLAAGTDGQYLQTQGASANPQWATVTGARSGLLLASGNGYALSNGSTRRGTVGTKAVSLEYSDSESGSGYGATGEFSVVGGGEYNSATNSWDTVCGGYHNTASGGGSITSGGYYNTASGLYSSVSGGYGNTASGGYSSVTGGTEAISSHFAEKAMSSGKFSSNGDCQRGSVQERASTSSTNATILYLDGSSAKFTLSSGDHYSCRVHLIGAQADGSTGDYYALVKIKRVTDTTSLSGTVRVLEAWEGDTNLGTPTISITADDTNDALQIAVTPANSTATRWTAVVEYVKINY